MGFKHPVRVATFANSLPVHPSYPVHTHRCDMLAWFPVAVLKLVVGWNPSMEGMEQANHSDVSVSARRHGGCTAST